MVAQQVRDTLKGRVGIQMAGEGSNPSFRSTTERLFVSYLNFYYNLERGCHSDIPNLSLIKLTKICKIKLLYTYINKQ